MSDDLTSSYNNNRNLSEEKIIELSYETLSQSRCKKWFFERLKRISSSKDVHSIKSRTRKSVEKLVNDMLHPKEIDTPATRYGIQNETKAKDMYKEIYNVDIKEVGLIVKYGQPWLCGSPDGVVVEDDIITKLLEIKCPKTCEKIPVVDYATETCNVNYLEIVNGLVQLKESHVYYTQCQIQTYLTGMSQCDLFVFSPVENGSCCINVHRNETFLKEAIYSSERFFFNHYLPALSNRNLKKNDDGSLTTDLKHISGCSVNPRRFTGRNIDNVACKK